MLIINPFEFAGGAKDEDAESGNGPSLPHSPHSVEGAIGGPKLCSDSDFEDSRHPSFDYKYVCFDYLFCLWLIEEFSIITNMLMVMLTKKDSILSL